MKRARNEINDCEVNEAPLCKITASEDLRMIANTSTHVPPAILEELSKNISEATHSSVFRTMNKLDVIGLQMQNLEHLIQEVIEEHKQNYELNKVSCNFVKIPGKTYYLYQKENNEMYFSMLSPQEWGVPPHKFLGQWLFGPDMSWSKDSSSDYLKGIKYLLKSNFIQNGSINSAQLSAIQ